MDEHEYNAPGRRKTYEEVQEERRAERIAAIKDSELRRELEERVLLREAELSKVREVQAQRRPEFVEDIRRRRGNSRSTFPTGPAEAEVATQYQGWIRSEATRHNKVIDQKLDEYEQSHGKEFDHERSKRDELYRRAVLEEDRPQTIHSSVQSDGTSLSVETPSTAPSQARQVALDPVRYVNDPLCRNQVDSQEKITERTQEQGPDAQIGALEIRGSLAARPIEQTSATTVQRPAVREAAREISGRGDHARDDISKRQEAITAGNANVPQETQSAQSPKKEEKIDRERYIQDPNYRRQINAEKNAERQAQKEERQQQRQGIGQRRHP
jgi:hypothetical protein